MKNILTGYLYLASLLVACWLLQDATASDVTLFEKSYQRGTSWSAKNFYGCRNIPRGFNDVASSISTHGTCVEICDYPNCGGGCRKYTGHDSAEITLHEDLAYNNFDNRASSVRSC